MWCTWERQTAVRTLRLRPRLRRCLRHTHRLADGTYQLLSTEHIFKDYQFSRGHEIALPEKQLNEF